MHDIVLIVIPLELDRQVRIRHLSIEHLQITKRRLRNQTAIVDH